MNTAPKPVQSFGPVSFLGGFPIGFAIGFAIGFTIGFAIANPCSPRIIPKPGNYSLQATFL